MSEGTHVERTLGNLDARMSAMESRMSALEGRIDSRLDRIESTMDEVHGAVISARGAWRAIAWVAGISGTVAAALYTLIHWFVAKP